MKKFIRWLYWKFAHDGDPWQQRLVVYHLSRISDKLGTSGDLLIAEINEKLEPLAEVRFTTMEQKMKKVAPLVLLLMLLPNLAWSGGKKAPVVEVPEVTSQCVEPEKKLFKMGPETYKDFLPGGRDHELAKKAFCLANVAYANGCLERKILAFKFATLEKDIDPQLKRSENEKAWYIFDPKGTPREINPRKYYTRTSIYGYTYFWRDNIRSNGTETRVWSNFNRYWTPEVYGAHLVHEFSHMAQSGAYGHWTQHWGSYPYTAGDAAEECIAEYQAEQAGVSLAGAQFQEEKAGRAKKRKNRRKPTSSACEEL